MKRSGDTYENETIEGRDDGTMAEKEKGILEQGNEERSSSKHERKKVIVYINNL